TVYNASDGDRTHKAESHPIASWVCLPISAPRHKPERGDGGPVKTSNRPRLVRAAQTALNLFSFRLPLFVTRLHVGLKQADNALEKGAVVFRDIYGKSNV